MIGLGSNKSGPFGLLWININLRHNLTERLSLLIAQGAKGPAEPRICRQQRLRLWIRRPRPAGQALGLLQIEYSNNIPIIFLDQQARHLVSWKSNIPTSSLKAQCAENITWRPGQVDGQQRQCSESPTLPPRRRYHQHYHRHHGKHFHLKNNFLGIVM